MKREIKFRGLRVDGKGWAYGYYRKNTFYNKLIDEPTDKVIYIKHFIGCFDNKSLFDGIFEQVEVIPETVGQLTPFKDIKGNESYNGDIVRIKLEDSVQPLGWYWWYAEIKQVNGCWVLCQLDFDYSKSPFDEYTLLYEYDGEFEITGNVHQNKLTN